LIIRCFINITGNVQGVGYRPFLYREAVGRNLSGQVRNDLSGVHLEIQGVEEQVNSFIEQTRSEFPPGALLKDYFVEQIMVVHGETSFDIVASSTTGARDAHIPLDSAVCSDCLTELEDSSDRRYQYPFINCVACGPRYSIIEQLPYDRPATSMHNFKMCPACTREYNSPESRRFHAQPNACPVCGPQLELLDSGGKSLETDDPLASACSLLADGKIVAIKGLGGFHLACDARNRKAVERLRRRKHRPAKPLALMVLDLEAAHNIARIDEAAAGLLTSRQSPIVLVVKHNPDPLPENIAPGTAEHGVMIAYTPVHHLILRRLQQQMPFPVLVMTSANESGAPIVYRNAQAVASLGELADAFLVHNRPIVNAADDSIVRPIDEGHLFLRRARGYAPAEFTLPFSARPMLAVGTHLKSTIAFSRGDRAVLSPHIGDLDSYETYNFFLSTIERLRNLLQFEPEAVVCDAHPDLPSTNYARRETGLPVIAVSHHRAHIAATLVDNGLWEPVIGVAFDGSGYGDDGSVWGGEFFCGEPSELTRAAHFAPMPLPGGDLAARLPWRMALSLLFQAYGDDRINEFLDLVPAPQTRELQIALLQIENKIACPSTSSAGRLFDAVAALALGIPQNFYEAQAAIALEAAADKDETGSYSFAYRREQMLSIDMQKTIHGIVEDLRREIAPGIISARFHNTMINIIVSTCIELNRESGIDLIALGGGSFANKLLVRGCLTQLQQAGFRVCFPKRLPPGDGSIALGQLALAATSSKV
jgi:hydrogenase maturation protein HypF